MRPETGGRELSTRLGKPKLTDGGGRGCDPKGEGNRGEADPEFNRKARTSDPCAGRARSEDLTRSAAAAGR